MASSHTVAGRMCNKVAAVFADGASAGAAAKELRATLHLGHGQVRVVHPRKAGPGWRRRLETAGIGHRLVRPQFLMALGGALAGALVFVLLQAMGVTLVVSSAIVVLVVLVVYGVVSGLLIGRLVGLRPDHGVSSHGASAHSVLAELHKGHAAVIVHAHDRAERDRADALLGAMGGMTMHSF